MSLGESGPVTGDDVSTVESAADGTDVGKESGMPEISDISVGPSSRTPGSERVGEVTKAL